MGGSKIKKTLIIAVSGIGATLLALPMIDHLRKSMPDCRIDLLAGQKGTVDLLEGYPSIDNIIFVNRKVLKDLFKNLINLIKLFFRRYDYSIMAFPGNRIAFNLLSFLIFAKKRLAHTYLTRKFISGSFLNNEKTIVEKVHDIENNLNILKLLNIDVSNANKKLSLSIDKKYKELAVGFLKKNKISKSFICLSPGASRDQPYKKWSYAKFGELADKLVKKYKCSIIIFAGFAELEAYDEVIKNVAQDRLKYIKEATNFDLRTVAFLIKMSRFSVTNDNSLMNIAAFVGTKVLSIIGANDPRRTRPWNNYFIASSNLYCHPCNRTLENVGNPFHCVQMDYYHKHEEYKCLDRITADMVMKKIKELLT